MGKASSSKKVARAAGTGGGRTARGRTPWTYYGIIALIIVLGVVGTVASRNTRLAAINKAGTTSPPAVGSTESAAFAVDVCGKILPNIKTTKDPVGITTDGDGIIHIHPTTASAAGANATLGLFASSIGMKLNASELQTPGGHLYLDGDKCNGVASHVYVRHFAYPGDTSGTLETSDPQLIHLDDGSEYTLAFVPSADKNTIPPPPASVVKDLTSLEAAAAAAAATTTTAGATTATTTGTTTATTTPSTSTSATTTPATTATTPSTTAKATTTTAKS
jgi:hypothetical protein